VNNKIFTIDGWPCNFLILFFLKLQKTYIKTFLSPQKKKKLEKIGIGREFKNNILAGELLVNSRESIKLVLERSGILAVKEAIIMCHVSPKIRSSG
jgi:hypothetical protein